MGARLATSKKPGDMGGEELRWMKRAKQTVARRHGWRRFVVHAPGLIAAMLLFCCDGDAPERRRADIPFKDLTVEPRAVSDMVTRVSLGHQLSQETISPALQALFTHLGKTPAAELVITPAHSQGEWQVEKVFLLDDCVAVQMSEGHYLETIFFTRYSQGWRLVARIVPHDHD